MSVLYVNGIRYERYRHNVVIAWQGNAFQFAKVMNALKGPPF